jgi:hypothetical protein
MKKILSTIVTIIAGLGVGAFIALVLLIGGWQPPEKMIHLGEIALWACSNPKAALTNQSIPRYFECGDPEPMVMFTQAEERAFRQEGKYVSLDGLKDYGFNEVNKKILIDFGTGKSDWPSRNKVQVYGEPDIELFLGPNAKSYVLVILLHQNPYVIDLLPYYPMQIKVSALVVMSPGMWDIAHDYPNEFPKVRDELSGTLLNQSEVYQKQIAALKNGG